MGPVLLHVCGGQQAQVLSPLPSCGSRGFGHFGSHRIER
jgi:hypothetical protein